MRNGITRSPLGGAGTRATVPTPGGSSFGWLLSRNVKSSAANAVASSSTADEAFAVRPHTSAGVLVDCSARAQHAHSTPLDNHFHGLMPAGTVAGHWQHYTAYTTIGEKKASVLLFEKKWNIRSPTRIGRSNRFSLADLLRFDVGQLAQLLHPKILQTFHPLVENKDVMAFACEPISMTLDQLFVDPEQIPLLHVEIKIGIIQLSDGLSYLHNSAKILHGNLTPTAVFVATNQHWKIANFAFAVVSTQNNVFPCYPWTKRLPACLQPDMDFLAPEYLQSNGGMHTVTTAADVFSFAVLICWLFNGGKRLIDVNNNIERYKIVVDQLDLALNCMEERLGDDALKNILAKALSRDVAQRPTARQITMNKNFDETSLNALRYLDDIGQEFDPTNKAVFLSHTLLAALPLIPELWFLRVLARFNEYLIDSVELYPSILKPLIYMLGKCESHNIPRLITWFRLILDNAQEKVLSHAVLDNMPVIFRRLNDEMIEDRCFDLLVFILSGSDPHLKQLALRVIPHMVDYLPLSFISQRLLPVFAVMGVYLENHFSRQVDFLNAIMHLSNRSDAALLHSLLAISSLCSDVHPAVVHSKSRLVQQIVTCDVSRLNDPLTISHHLLNPLVLGLALAELNLSHFEEVMSSIRVLLEIVEQLRYQSANLINSGGECGRRLCNRRVSMSSNHLPRLLITAARPSFSDGRKMSFLSADGRLEDRGSRRESRDSRCSFESDVSLRIGNGSDFSDDSAIQAIGGGAGSGGSDGAGGGAHAADALGELSHGQHGRRRSWLKGYMHSLSLEQSSQSSSVILMERRGSAIDRQLKRSLINDRCATLGRFKSVTQAPLVQPPPPPTPPLSHSSCGGYATLPAAGAGTRAPLASANRPLDTSSTSLSEISGAQKNFTAKPTTFTNLGHNLVGFFFLNHV